MKQKFYTITILLFICSGSLRAQDYFISFAGFGGSTTIDSIRVENLTQGNNLVMHGNVVLHLMGVITGIETVMGDETNKIGIYPNPMKDYARMQFVLPETGETMITLYDLSGRKIAQTQDLLSKGQHIYRIQGVGEGLYIVKISSGRYSYSGRLICSGSQNRNARIEYENTIAAQKKQSDSKGTNAESLMQYHDGDRLKLTGISDIYSTVIIDVPTESKIITFNFITCTDEDRNNYPIVKLGTQIWMAENLKTTKYNDGTAIPNVTDGSEWAGLTTPAYCWYNNNIGNKDLYGALYNWYVVKTGKLCPSGWHVPTDAEWHQLVLSLDPDAALSVAESEIAGNKLKEEGTTHWASPNTGATNETGFTALPGGNRRYDGLYSGPTGNGTWRTASEYDSTRVWYRYMFYHSGYVYRNITNKQAGYSVRCIRD
jgi:uncharacterized protein (TIGR02145 family)